MKVLLLNPPNQFKISKTSRWPEWTKSGTLYYPFWLAYATSVLMESKHKPLLLDAIAKNLDFQMTLEKIQDFNPDMVVIESSTPSVHRDAQFADDVKKISDSKIVFAGRHVTATTEQTLKMFKSIDIVARGEYDYTILDIANELNNGQNLKEVVGISFRENGNIINTPIRQLTQNLDEMPFVSKAYREFLDVRDYRYALAQHPMLQLWSSRGCPNRCTYCDYPQVMTMHTFRMRSAKNVVDEMEYIHKNLPNVKEIFLEDDTFTIDRNRTFEICKEIQERKLKLIWSCNVRANLDYDILKAMKEAGCRILIVGYESGNQQVLNNIKKGIALKQAEEFTKHAQKLGLRIFGCFMIGLPGDTKGSINDTLQFAKKMHPDMVFFQQGVPFPGTEFYEWAKYMGYLKTEDYSKWFDETGRLDCLVNQPGLSGEEVKKMRENLMLRYYLDPRHIFYTLRRNLHPFEFVRVVHYAKDYLAFLMLKKLKSMQKKSVKDDTPLIHHKHEEKGPFEERLLQST